MSNKRMKKTITKILKAMGTPSRGDDNSDFPAAV